eukprot:TsM_000392800 transcript=TsM_000392800 gene=TsM_000392800
MSTKCLILYATLPLKFDVDFKKASMGSAFLLATNSPKSKVGEARKRCACCNYWFRLLALQLVLVSGASFAAKIRRCRKHLLAS